MLHFLSMRLRFYSLLIGLQIVNLLSAQPSGTLEGQVTDLKGNKLALVSVYAEGTDAGTVTNSDGYFSLVLEPAAYTIRFTSVGYESMNRVVDLKADAFLDVQLREGLYELPEIIIGRETMTGGSLYVKDIPGSAHYISLPELQKFNYTDINRVLRNIPGVNLQEEDGFGLRPNIGLRGSGVERSSKITLMEDGVLAAPAPYSAPAAYYFPTAGRMFGVEVRKGSSQIKYGPYTVGGAINFLSTPIPHDIAARVNLSAGNFGRRVVQASVGQSFTHGGFVVETFQNKADGFKKLDNGGPTGFSNQDYLAKVRFNSEPGAKIYQAVLFKIGQMEGNSDETYLGLTEGDFEASPYRRYYGSQMDHIRTKQHQYSVKYSILPARFLNLSVTAYKSDFKRNWYKLDQVKYGTGSKTAIAAILDDPETYNQQYGILKGLTSPNEDALFVRNNNREYFSKGIQGIVGMNFSGGTLEQDLELGFRFHRDEEDRFQWDDSYAMEQGVMKLNQKGKPGTESNRISQANATAAYVQYTLKYGKFKALPGLRYEKIRLNREDYGKEDSSRTGTSLKETVNEVQVLIPGFGFEYEFNPSSMAFGGIHRGFSPPGVADGSLPENAINYEIGGRYVRGKMNGQAVAFLNDYKNLLGSDLAASGGGGIGDPFNAGKAIIFGIEAEAGLTLTGSTKKWSLPLSMAYTYTQGEFSSTFEAIHEDWGKVEKGDEMPYLSTHQLVVNAGFQHSLYSIHLSSKYNSPMRTNPGSGSLTESEQINRNLIIDLAVDYTINRYLSCFGNINNLFNEVYVVARRPAGLRPGMPRAGQVGIRVKL